MKFPVFDLHCDTALRLLGEDLNPTGELKENNGHVDLLRAGELAGYAQCFACFTTPWEDLPNGITVTQLFEREMVGILGQIEKNKDTIRQAFTAEDIRKNYAEGKMSAILTIEGPAGFGFDPALLEDLYKVGFRISTLTWNEKNPLAGSHITGGGLTDLGATYFQEAQRLGMIVDVSHLSDEAFWDMMKITQAPIIATHSDSRGVRDISRNLSDDMFRAICETGGVSGINLCAEFLGEKNVDLDTVCDHIFHFMELDPSGTHIALGGDLDGVDQLPQGFTGVNSYNALAETLLRRGLDEKTIENIYWNNAMGVMDRAVCNHKIGS